MIPSRVLALIRTTPTIAPVPHRAIISVVGPQAAEFLNGLIASSIPSSPQAHFFSAFLHAQGRVIHDAFFHSNPNPTTGSHGYLIEYDSRESEAPPLLSMLKRYVLRSKVKIRDVSDEYDVWASWGSEKEKSWETQRQWTVAQSGVVEPVWDQHESSWPWGSEPGIVRDRRAVGLGHRLIVKKGERPQEASTHDVASSSDYLLHRIMHGVPEGNVDIQPLHSFPMDSNLDIMCGLDFRKGCYVGQELTVRTYHTGVIRKRIFPVTINHRNASDSSEIDTLSLPENLSIRTRIIQSFDGAETTPRPRGSGKLLSSSHGVGLALLRLEHVVAAENGKAVLEVESEDEPSLTLSTFRPDWWPRLLPQQS